MILFYNETKCKASLIIETDVTKGTTPSTLTVNLKYDGETSASTPILNVVEPSLIELLSNRISDGITFKFKTGRFYVKPPVGKFGFDGDNVITFDPTDESMRNTCRNIVVIIKHKDSRVIVPYSVLTQKEPIKSVTTGEYQIVVYGVKFNNWAKLKYPTYIYMDGVDGKKQLKLGFIKADNGRFTSNVLFEEDFTDDEFPMFKKNNNHKSYNGDGKYNNNNNRHNNNSKYNNHSRRDR